jgi:tRNA pseudouridine38-40 synthase
MRYALGIEYDGSAFYGWQVQRQEPTVQGCLEAALSRVADHPVRVACCGRTDTGVHALCQVAHFDSTAVRAERSWILGACSHLPPGISLLWVRPVTGDFHARFSACARTYRYRILNRWVRPALEARRAGWCRKPLDAGLMNRAAQVLRGEHDFSAFRAASCQARHAVRDIHQIAVVRAGNEVSIEVTANGFLYHMMRNIAGSLVAIGQGDRPADWLQALLAGRDRTLAAPTAAAEGLYFVGARYPEQYGLPAAAMDFPPAGSAP